MTNVTTTRTLRNQHMDPAALGTTIIGLDAIRADEHRTPPPLPHQRRTRGRLATARQLVANVLRRAADAVAPTPGGLTRAR